MTRGVDAALRAEIDALVTEHSFLVDHNRHDELADLYTVDGTLTGLATMNFRSPAEIRAWAVARVADTTMVVRHLQSNLHLRWDGDVLRGTSYYTMLRGTVAEPGTASPFSMGEFEDEYARIDGAWRIRHRRINRVFADGQPVTPTSIGRP